MKQEAQRIAIAEACGWTYTKTSLGLPYGRKPKGTHPRLFRREVRWDVPLPDYPNDLNAMHEAEKALTAGQWHKYDNMMPLRDPQKMHATASQKAKAFLQAINKWEESA